MTDSPIRFSFISLPTMIRQIGFRGAIFAPHPALRLDHPRPNPYNGFAMKYSIQTLGCQMNVADSQRLASELERLGVSRRQ